MKVLRFEDVHKLNIINKDSQSEVCSQSYICNVSLSIHPPTGRLTAITTIQSINFLFKGFIHYLQHWCTRYRTREPTRCCWWWLIQLKCCQMRLMSVHCFPYFHVFRLSFNKIISFVILPNNTSVSQLRFFTCQPRFNRYMKLPVMLGMSFATVRRSLFPGSQSPD